MEILALLALGIVAGQIASIVGTYNLGFFGNAIAGVTGALFIGNYATTIFGISPYLGMFAGGFVGAFVILAVFSAGEAMSGKKKRLF
jgi:uncharacterized membrane protein YeaQ/YmgE (transglycosylase-associated protein family)